MFYVNLGYLQSCRHIQLQDSGAQSGVYIIETKVSNKILNVFCDMETYGGGWTLVWSYRFNKIR